MENKKELEFCRVLQIGKLVMTKGVHTKTLEDPAFNNFVVESLTKYIQCDWGDTCEEDAKRNDESAKNGERVFAVYKHIRGETIWIITEWDRSVTTILFPSEY